MKKVFEYNGPFDPQFFSTLKKAYNTAKVDLGEGNIVSYRTVRKHIREKGCWEVEVEWLGDYISITKREVL